MSDDIFLPSAGGDILVVDDTLASLKLLTDILQENGYLVRPANDGELALRSVQARRPALVLLDIRMPGIDGFEVCRRLNADPTTRDIPVIFLSSLTDTADKAKGFELGAVDFVSKPVDAGEVLARVKAHLGLSFAKEQLKAKNLELNSANSRLVEEIAERKLAEEELRRHKEHLEELVAARTAQLRKALVGSIEAVASCVEIRDPYTSGHQHRVAKLATAIARELKLSEPLIQGIDLTSQIHDIGKISVPAEILSMPRRLTEVEMALVRHHCQAGYDAVKDIDFPWPVARAILQHHERLDGSGYPNGLKGDDIIMEARYIAVADVVEAMSSHRPYRPGFGSEAALAEIEHKRGVYFDPQVVDACLRLFREKEFKFAD